MQRQVRIDPATVVGWGVDADPKNDPTYPIRQRPEDAASDRGLTWQRPTSQLQKVELLASTEHNRRTAVFGTSTPPQGLSGAIRRQAFHKSEGKWSHWLMLLLADRIDVVEGVLRDLGRGHVPDILGEMGIRSEMKHNMPGLMRKVAIGGLAITAAVMVAQSLNAQRGARRYAGSRRRHPARPLSASLPRRPAQPNYDRPAS